MNKQWIDVFIVEVYHTMLILKNLECINFNASKNAKGILTDVMEGKTSIFCIVNFFTYINLYIVLIIHIIDLEKHGDMAELGRREGLKIPWAVMPV